MGINPRGFSQVCVANDQISSIACILDWQGNMGAAGFEPALDRFSYHYSFRYAVVWTMPLPFTCAVRQEPSSLYTFLGDEASLGVAISGFTEFDSIHARHFCRDALYLKVC